MQQTGNKTRPPFAGRCGVVLFCLSTLAACGPQVELPPLPNVSTEGFLDDVKKQMHDACKSVDAHPADSQVNGRYGLILGAYGHDPAASVAFDRARRLSPDQPHIVRAAEFYRRGELEKALAELQIAHEKNPDNVGTHVHLVRFYGQAKNLDKSLYRIKRARELDPNFSQLHSNMGFAYQYAGQSDNAVSAYRQALQLAGVVATDYGNDAMIAALDSDIGKVGRGQSGP